MCGEDKQMGAGLERGCSTMGVTRAGTQGLHDKAGSSAFHRGTGRALGVGGDRSRRPHLMPLYVRIAELPGTPPHCGMGQMSLSISEKKFF